MSYAAEEMDWSGRDEAMQSDGLVEVLEGRTRDGSPMVAVNRRGEQSLYSLRTADTIAREVIKDVSRAHSESYTGRYLCEGRNNARYILFPAKRRDWVVGLDEALRIATDILAAINDWEACKSAA